MKIKFQRPPKRQKPSQLAVNAEFKRKGDEKYKVALERRQLRNKHAS